MKLKILNLAVIVFCFSAQANVQVSNSKGEQIEAPAQNVQQSSVQDLQQQAGQWGLNQDDYQRYQSAEKRSAWDSVARAGSAVYVGH